MGKQYCCVEQSVNIFDKTVKKYDFSKWSTCNYAIFAESDEGGDDDEEEINVHDLEEHAANGGNFINKKIIYKFLRLFTIIFWNYLLHI